MDGAFCKEKKISSREIGSDKKMTSRKGSQAHLRVKVFRTNSPWLVGFIRISPPAETPLCILIRCGQRVAILTLGEGP